MRLSTAVFIQRECKHINSLCGYRKAFNSTEDDLSEVIRKEILEFQMAVKGSYSIMGIINGTVEGLTV
jgi:hypothetical protein